MKKTNGNNSSPPGWTLMEILVVLASLAVLSGAGIPMVASRLPDYRLKAAARDLRSNLHRAKQEAVRLNGPCAVYFDPDENRYQIVSAGPDGVCDGAPAGTPPIPKNDDILIKDVSLVRYGSGVRFGEGNAQKTVSGKPIPSGILVSYVQDRVRFDGKGMARELGYAYLTNQKHGAFAVGTPSMAGAVVLKRWLGTAWQ